MTTRDFITHAQRSSFDGDRLGRTQHGGLRDLGAMLLAGLFDEDVQEPVVMTSNTSGAALMHSALD